MHKIIKYILEFPYSCEQEIVLPSGSAVLSIQNHRETPALYALVDESKSRDMKVRIRGIMMGDTINANGNEHWTYVSTASFRGGDLVIHYFVCMSTLNSTTKH